MISVEADIFVVELFSKDEVARITACYLILWRKVIAIFIKGFQR